MTTHPGVDGGWTTERWLRKIVKELQAPDEIAFAYGFIGHASGDIFAHTFVNQYAGDIFVLTDKETQVELRHFSLEKYIRVEKGRLSHSAWTSDHWAFQRNLPRGN